LYNDAKEATLEFDSIYIIKYPDPGDIIYKSSYNPFGVNLNPDTDSTGFTISIFKNDTSWTDTIEIFYNSELRLISYACGFTCFYALDTIVTISERIKSIDIIFENVFNYETENIKISY
jgi:hypothetical protein